MGQLRDKSRFGDNLIALRVLDGAGLKASNLVKEANQMMNGDLYEPTMDLPRDGWNKESAITIIDSEDEFAEPPVAHSDVEMRSENAQSKVKKYLDDLPDRKSLSPIVESSSGMTSDEDRLPKSERSTMIEGSKREQAQLDLTPRYSPPNRRKKDEFEPTNVHSSTSAKSSPVSNNGYGPIEIADKGSLESHSSGSAAEQVGPLAERSASGMTEESLESSIRNSLGSTHAATQPCDTHLCEAPHCRKRFHFKPWTQLGPRHQALCTDCSRVRLEFLEASQEILQEFERMIQHEAHFKADREERGCEQDLDPDAPVDDPNALQKQPSSSETLHGANDTNPFAFDHRAHGPIPKRTPVYSPLVPASSSMPSSPPNYHFEENPVTVNTFSLSAVHPQISLPALDERDCFDDAMDALRDRSRHTSRTLPTRGPSQEIMFEEEYHEDANVDAGYASESANTTEKGVESIDLDYEAVYGDMEDAAGAPDKESDGEFVDDDNGDMADEEDNESDSGFGE